MKRALLATFATLAISGTPAVAYDLIDPVTFWAVGDVKWEVKLVGNGSNIPIPSGGSPLQDGSSSWGAALQKSIDALNAVIPDNVLTLSIEPNSALDPGNSNGVNNVGFSTTIYGNAWSGSVVGISISTWVGQRKTENDVLFNANKTWDAYEGNVQGGAVDLRRVAIHEFGHSLGLDHPDQAGQTVSAIMNSATNDTWQLETDDIDGLLFLYGAIMPVQITSHPKSYSVPAGGTWPLSVTATGSELITYDWEQSTNGGATWTDVMGIGSDINNWSLSGMGLSDSGMQMRVNVINPAGTVTSSVATLTVTATQVAPAITTQPSSTAVNVGTTASFTVAASGSPTPTIQWQYSTDGGTNWFNVINGPVLPSGAIYSGATTNQLQLAFAPAAFSGRMYRARASNTFNDNPLTVNSNAVTLTVNGAAVAPGITTQPANQTVFEGDPASFSVSATGTAPLSYQWKKGGVDIGGATSSSYVIASAMEADEGSYTVVVSNSAGSVTSSAATLTVDPAPTPPSITTHPSSLSVAVGGLANFSVVATGTAPLAYQWKKGGVDISGANSSTYSIASAQVGDAGIYTVVVSNAGGQATSNGATLTVGTPPSITTHPMMQTAVIGSTVIFSVEASGTAPLSYQWKLNGANIAGATAATYSISSLEAGQGGNYSVVVSNAGGSVTSNNALLTVDSTPRLINISTRARAGSGDSTLIVGFYVAGTGSKTVLIRGIGPKLVDQNVSNPVQDPSLSVYSGSTVIAQNDDWSASLATDFARVGAFPLDAGSKDAALVVTLAPGAYTVHLINPGATAEALIEVYDLSRDLGTRLVNLSCRLSINPGETVIVGTYMLAGSQNILFRNAGPGLVFAFPQLFTPSVVLPDPRLTVYSGSTSISENDDWNSALAANFMAVGAFAYETGSKDSAIRVNLAQGPYTVHAVGNTGGGIALIELYESQ